MVEEVVQVPAEEFVTDRVTHLYSKRSAGRWWWLRKILISWRAAITVQEQQWEVYLLEPFGAHPGSD